jgi:uncharacterized membrane protein
VTSGVVAVAETGRTGRRRSDRWIPIALIGLVLIPVIAGPLRLVEVFGGPHNLTANPRITASPVPVVVHIISACGYAVLGAFQFSPQLRRRHPGWHRRTGRALVVLGLTVALSALWMTLFYPRPQGTGALLPVRLAFPAAMAAGIILGFSAIRRGDIRRHRAWMTRAYAIALGAGTQVFTLGFGKPIFGTSELTIALLLIAAWCINLPIAEYIIRRPKTRRIATETPWARAA